VTRAFLDVLEALLWGFHNSRSGVCFPSYERIAEKAECARSTVAEALRVLEWAGVLSWQHRITRIRERCTDLFGREGWRWRVIRTSNCYQFCDPQAVNSRPVPFQVRKSAGNTEPRCSNPACSTAACGKPTTGALSEALERALARLGGVLAAKDGIEQGAGG
jgi:hypothetical protein